MYNLSLGPIVKLETPITEITEHAKYRQSSKRSNNIRNQQVDTRRDSLTTELVGMVGEFIVAQYYSKLLKQDIRVNLDDYMGGDNGIDFADINGYSIDVKTGNYVHNDLIFPDLSKFRADIAILVVPVSRQYQSFLREENPLMRIAGWEYREVFINDCIYHYRHTEPAMERASGTWWGYGKTQTNVLMDCSKCDHHANPIRPIKIPHHATT
jgi:hypothetical protein